MNGTQEAPAGAPLAAHFEAKRRIMATVKQMEERGEKLEEATPEEILEAANKAADTVFKFDFSISEGAEDAEASNKKRNRNRKRNKKRRAKKPQDESEKSEKSTTERSVAPAQQGTTKDKQKKKQEQVVTNGATGNKRTGSSFLTLRKATGTESEVAKMHLRYGQGRRNLAATKQREQRKKEKAEEGAAASGDFKFNFAAA
eukprot:jgi/Phyca11/526012/estExt2_fgenesh1_pm.C_PHYCAscaffold_60095